MRKLKVTLEIDVDELPDADRQIIARGLCFDDESPEAVAEMEEELPKLADTSPMEAASPLQGIVENDLLGELFAGTEVYVTYKAVKVQSAEWVND